MTPFVMIVICVFFCVLFVFVSMYSWTMEQLMMVWDLSKEAGNAIRKTTVGVTNNINQVATTTMKHISEAVLEASLEASRFFESSGDAVSDAFENTVSYVLSIPERIIKQIVAELSRFFQQIKNYVINLLNKIKETVRQQMDVIVQTGETLVRDFENSVGKFVDEIKELVRNIVKVTAEQYINDINQTSVVVRNNIETFSTNATTTINNKVREGFAALTTFVGDESNRLVNKVREVYYEVEGQWHGLKSGSVIKYAFRGDDVSGMYYADFGERGECSIQ
jgi:hypothetical protein